MNESLLYYLLKRRIFGFIQYFLVNSFNEVLIYAISFILQKAQIVLKHVANSTVWL
jgi:hypothetical protein